MTDITDDGPTTPDPQPASAQDRRPGGSGWWRRQDRRWWLVAIIAAALLITAGVVAGVIRRDTDAPGQAGTTPTTTTVPATVATTASPSTGLAPTSLPSSTSTPPADGIDADQRAATAAFTAWQVGDRAALSRLATIPAAAFLAARAPRPDDNWQGPTCRRPLEGNDTTHCVWSGTHSQLAISVNRDRVRAGDDPVVFAARVSAPEGWLTLELATRADADALQASVDAGHQPWRLDGAEVARAYLRSELGWHDVSITRLPSGIYRVTDTATGTTVDVAESRPSGATPQGIYSVDSVTSAPA